MATGWDNYWSGSGRRDAFAGGNEAHPAIRAFWREILGPLSAGGKSPFMVDLASGSGAVLRAAVTDSDWQPARVLSVDSSTAALAGIADRFPEAQVLNADATRLPFADAVADVVTSQFGIEYAGRPAFAEAARLVAPGGHLALVLHRSDSSICSASAANLAATGVLLESGFLPLAKQLFETGFAAAGGASRTAYDEAAAAMGPAIGSLEQAMTRHGTGVADGLLQRLYDDVATAHEHLASTEPVALLSWLDAMQAEVIAYRDRMQSMCAAALGDDDLGWLAQFLDEQGFALQRNEILRDPSTGAPLAHAVHALRPAA